MDYNGRIFLRIYENDVVNMSELAILTTKMVFKNGFIQQSCSLSYKQSLPQRKSDSLSE
jgi:hypothetical protein